MRANQIDTNSIGFWREKHREKREKYFNWYQRSSSVEPSRSRDCKLESEMLKQETSSSDDFRKYSDEEGNLEILAKVLLKHKQQRLYLSLMMKSKRHLIWFPHKHCCQFSLITIFRNISSIPFDKKPVSLKFVRQSRQMST